MKKEKKGGRKIKRQKEANPNPNSHVRFKTLSSDGSCGAPSPLEDLEESQALEG
jgi:hypothetical protein